MSMALDAGRTCVQLSPASVDRNTPDSLAAKRVWVPGTVSSRIVFCQFAVCGNGIQLMPPLVVRKTPAPGIPDELPTASPVAANRRLEFVGSATIDVTDIDARKSVIGDHEPPPSVVFQIPPHTPPRYP